jgi:hypothetical protein
LPRKPARQPVLHPHQKFIAGQGGCRSQFAGGAVTDWVSRSSLLM